MKLQANINGIKNISLDIFQKEELIKNEINNNILPLLKESSIYYKNTRSDISNDIEDVIELFDKFDQKCDDLSLILDMYVVKFYSELSDDIRNLFNKELLNKLDELIKESNNIDNNL